MLYQSLGSITVISKAGPHGDYAQLVNKLAALCTIKFCAAKNREVFDFLKQATTNKHYYAKDMPIGPQSCIGVTRHITTAYPT
jgi:hypothetical protein